MNNDKNNPYLFNTMTAVDYMHSGADEESLLTIWLWQVVSLIAMLAVTLPFIG